MPACWARPPGDGPTNSRRSSLGSRWCCWCGRMGKPHPGGIPCMAERRAIQSRPGLGAAEPRPQPARCQPQFVLFDSWYPAKRLLKRLKDYGWYFVCQLKKNRVFDGVALHAYRPHPYWHAVGALSGGLKVLVVRHRRTYYVTNRLTLTAPGGARPLPQTAGGGGSHPGPQEPAELRGLSSGLQAARSRHRPVRSHVLKSITLPYVWWPTLLWSVSALITGSPGGNSRSVSSSKADRSHCQRWSG